MGLQLNTVIPWGRNFNEYMNSKKTEIKC